MRLRASKESAYTVKEANHAESIGQTSQLEIHVKRNVLDLSGQVKGLKKTQAGFQCFNLDAEFLLLWETLVFALKPLLEMTKRAPFTL